MSGREATLCGWGRLCAPGTEQRSEDLESASRTLPLSRGLGRSYGDSSLPPPDDARALNTTLADRVLAFDAQSGALRAEAGLSLWQMNRLFLRRGWFTAVSPGTQFVTLGGMVAADVHGKNHHVAGCIGEHVQALRMRVADGRVLECSRQQYPELFQATLGGMGLTGHILEVECNLHRAPTPWIVQESQRIDDIDAFQAALQDAASKWPFTVGWIDCVSRGKNLGRGILIAGRWAEPHEAPATPPPEPRPLAMPVNLPSWALSRGNVQLFNHLYYWKHWQRRRLDVVTPHSFFYPLDAITEWNRLYGKRGFTQYQCVLPRDGDSRAARWLLELLTRLGGASFLCVIKDCGAQGSGTLSFPMPGISIALDIPVRSHTQALVDRLNEQVIAAGGRIYLAKDAFTRAEHFRAMEPRLDEFRRIRDVWDPQRHFRSRQSIRLLGDSPQPGRLP